MKLKRERRIAIDRGGIFLPAFHQKMALWDAYQVLFFVSFKMNPRIRSRRHPRQIHASWIPAEPASLLDRSSFTTSRGTTEISSNASHGNTSRRIPWRKGKKKTKRKKEKKREMPVKRLLVSVEFILIISTFFLRRETHLPATEENLHSLALSFFHTLSSSLFHFSSSPSPFLISQPLSVRQ